MRKLLIGLAALPFLAGLAMAGQPKPLTDTQMDKVTAGQLGLIEIECNGIELNFFPITQNAVEGPHTDSDAGHAFGGLVCTGACSWFSS